MKKKKIFVGKKERKKRKTEERNTGVQVEVK